MATDRNGRQSLAVVGASIGFVTLVIVLAMAALGRRPPEGDRTTMGSHSGGGGRIARATEEPYPAAMPTATATMGTLPSGQLPVPAGVVTETVSIRSSPYSSLLQPLDSALQAQDFAVLGAMLRPVTDDYGTFPYFEISVHGALTFLRSEDRSTVFDELFSLGAQPRMQGYFDSEFGAARLGCIELFVSGWPYLSSSGVLMSTPPRNEATELPQTGPTPIRATGSGEFEGGVDAIEDGTYIWEVCSDGGPIEIRDWRVQHYDQAVESEYVSAQRMFTDGERPDQARYFVIVE